MRAFPAALALLWLTGLASWQLHGQEKGVPQAGVEDDGGGSAPKQGDDRPQDGENFFGETIAIFGTVNVTRGIMEFKASSEEKFQYDDEISTGDDGRLQISFGSSFASIGPNTTLLLNKRFELKKEIISIHLESGRFRSKLILKENEGYEVITSSGSARVCGTDFVTGFNPDGNGRFSITVISGRVEIHTSNDEIRSQGGTSETLADRQHSDLNAKGRASPVKELYPDALEVIKKQLPIPEFIEAPIVEQEKQVPEEMADGFSISPKNLDMEQLLSPPADIRQPPPSQANAQQVAQQQVEEQAENIQEDIKNEAVNEVNRQLSDRKTLNLQFRIEVD